mgnify:CR=1 FL=1
MQRDVADVHRRVGIDETGRAVMGLAPVVAGISRGAAGAQKGGEEQRAAAYEQHVALSDA